MDMKLEVSDWANPWTEDGTSIEYPKSLETENLLGIKLWENLFPFWFYFC